MIKSLNLPAIQARLPQVGLSPAKLAARLHVSRETVSKWLHGESIPKPDKLLRLGTTLNLKFEELVVLALPEAVPVVSFRRKTARKTRDNHLDNARETGELLKELVKYLPDTRLTHAPVLKEPRLDYDYIQRIAKDVREEMGLMSKQAIDFNDLIGMFNRLHAIIIPALWGEKQHHGNALNIYLPDSETTWVFLNLDSNLLDFKFWMAHELGHALAPTLDGDIGEDFADAFAQALLFPEPDVVTLRNKLEMLPRVSMRVQKIKTEAKKRIISPYTLRMAIEDYESAHEAAPINLGARNQFMAIATTFKKHFNTVTQLIFHNTTPDPAAYINSATETFGSGFFDALAAYCQQESGAEAYLHQVLGVSLADAKGLIAEFKK